MAPFDEIAFHVYAVDRVRPVEHDELDVVARAGFHRVRHRPDVGVVARADVLDVEDDRVETVEHLFRGNAGRPVETPDGKARDRVGVVLDFDEILRGRPQPVLGTEQTGELNLFSSVEPIDRMVQLAVHGRGVRDETDGLSRDPLDLGA